MELTFVKTAFGDWVLMNSGDNSSVTCLNRYFRGGAGLKMKKRIYVFLVNRHPGISARYHKLHDGSRGAVKILSWLYLAWLNFAYYVLRFRFLGRVPEVDMYESRRLNCTQSESEEYLRKNPQLSVERYVEKLCAYDVVSFDIFDTLIFRPLALPSDVFYMVGNELGIMDFKNIRIWAEWDARVKFNAREGNMEVGLSDIWDNLREDVGVSSGEGQAIEASIEEKLCYANPFMLEVWERLAAAGKKRIIVSDMYLPKEVITGILERAGFVGADKVYISSEYHKNKAGGRLFREAILDIYGVDTDDKVKPGNNISSAKGKINRNPNGFSIVHVGDNPHSDVDMARGYGLDVLPYQNVDKNVLLYRAFDMSPMVGSAYRAVVSSHLYSGLRSYPMEYEYGFIYGGLFVLGYCVFIHDYCRRHGVEKLLFLSRDGDILKQAYDYLYPAEETEYVYWSRKAATKLEAFFDKHDYFRRFVYHKVNQGYTIKEILHSMELDFLLHELGGWREIWTKKVKELETESRELALRQLRGKGTKGQENEKVRARIEKDFSEEILAKKREKSFIDLNAGDELTDRNGYLLRQFIEAKWDKVLACYAGQAEAAKTYYGKILSGCGKAAVVDIGWAGSGALALRHLVAEEWKIPCEVIGIIAGTNTIHNAEPDASESFLQSGSLAAYLYSQSHNRDLLKKHDPNRGYNIFWELLLSSTEPQFQGFYPEGPVFGRYDANQKGIREIQKGILDFVREYHGHFKDFPYMLQISGRDAYAPMLAAASHNERYLKAVGKKFSLEINVD